MTRYEEQLYKQRIEELEAELNALKIQRQIERRAAAKDEGEVDWGTCD